MKIFKLFLIISLCSFSFIACKKKGSDSDDRFSEVTKMRQETIKLNEKSQRAGKRSKRKRDLSKFKKK